MKVKCKYCNEKDEKDLMVYIEKNGKKEYFHRPCLRYKTDRDEALKLFYEYTGSYEMQSKVYHAFKQIRNKGLTDSDVLYIMQYIIKNKCVLNYPIGMMYYVDRAMKDKQESSKTNKNNERVINAPIKVMPLYMKKEEQKDDKENENDISDFL